MARPQDRRPRRKADPIDTDYRGQRIASNGALEVHTPFGFSGKVSSGNFVSTLALLGLLVAISVIGYFIWDSQVKGFKLLNASIETQTQIVSQYSSDLRSARHSSEKEHADIGRAFSDVAYIISMPVERRERLGLEEPPGLRKRLRGD
jgi:hypothetical protein